MINFRFATSGVLSAAMLTSFVPLARADTTISLERNRVVPVRLNKDLSIKKSHVGDRFSATVENDLDLPGGTEFLGRVTSVQKEHDDQPPYLAVVFDGVRLPDGTRASLKAVPVTMEGGVVKRDNRGRYYATRKVIRKDQAVLGGAVAGLVIGSILKKPFEGAVLGAVAGIVVGQDQKRLQETATLPKGTKLGALIDQPVQLAYNGDWRGYDEDVVYQDDYRNRDGYAQRRDDRGWRRGDRRDSRDDYGYDRNIRITHQGRVLSYDADASPYRSGSAIMVPLGRTADQLGLEVNTYERDGTIMVDNGEATLRLEQGSTAYRLNGRSGTLSNEVSVRNGVTYVPLSILAKMKTEPILANGTRVQID